MINKTSPDFLLNPFEISNLNGVLTLNNLLYPDHPSSLESMHHHEKTRSQKILHKHFVWEKNNMILCSALYTQWEDAYHPQKFVINIIVHPDHQGLGYGTFCYDLLLKEIKIFDPIKISAQVYELHKHSVHFLEKRGYKNTIKERESILDLTSYNSHLYQNKIDHVLQHGFRIVTLSEFRRENNNADYMVWELERDVGPDMPWTDPITIPEFDVYKNTVIAHPKFNPDSWFIALDGDRIAGLSHLWKNEIEKGIDTGLTAVRREYRRKGVASALKHTSLSWAKNQGYKWIRTDNAAVNEGMLSINIRSGFKFLPAWLIFEKFLKGKS